MASPTDLTSRWRQAMTKIGTVPIATRYAEDLASTRACYTDVVGQEVVYRDDKRDERA